MDAMENDWILCTDKMTKSSRKNSTNARNIETTL